MPNWDGKTERRNISSDHDALIQLTTIVSAHVEAAKLVADNLKEHEVQDQANFDGIRGDILVLQRTVWIATGIIIGLDALPKLAEIVHLVK